MPQIIYEMSVSVQWESYKIKRTFSWIDSFTSTLLSILTSLDPGLRVESRMIISGISYFLRYHTTAWYSLNHIIVFWSKYF